MGKGYGIASLIISIIGIFVAGIILGPIAIILGLVGRKKDDSKGLATAGLIIGIIVTILWIILIIFLGFHLAGAAPSDGGGGETSSSGGGRALG